MQKGGTPSCGHSRIQHHVMVVGPATIAVLIVVVAALISLLYTSAVRLHSTQEEYNRSRNALNELGTDYVDLQRDFVRLKANYSVLESEWLYERNLTTIAARELYQTKEALSTALLPPYISIHNHTVYVVFKRSDGSLLEWTTPFAALDNDLRRGQLKREGSILVPLHNSYETTTLSLMDDWISEETALCSAYRDTSLACGKGDINCEDREAALRYRRSQLKQESDAYLASLIRQGNSYRTFDNDGEQLRVMDFAPYVDASAFTDTIPSLYYQIRDDEAFIREVWYIVAQLTTYSTDIEETPRYPLETFLSGGGDCEDTAILVASMLKAVPRSWRVQLVYMDSAHPDAAQTANHVIVSVDTGTRRYFIETTDKREMNPYTAIDGWYVDV